VEPPKFWLNPNSIEPFRFKLDVPNPVKPRNGVDLAKHALEEFLCPIHFSRRARFSSCKAAVTALLPI
jgi:hypothetical protein